MIFKKNPTATRLSLRSLPTAKNQILKAKIVILRGKPTLPGNNLANIRRSDGKNSQLEANKKWRNKHSSIQILIDPELHKSISKWQDKSGYTHKEIYLAGIEALKSKKDVG